MPMDIQQYLDRIAFAGTPSVDPETLFALQKAHLMHVPFENLDIHREKTIVLDREAFFQKVVVDRRGGFCYELNVAFVELLRAIGFHAVKISARVANKEGGFGPEFDHLAILVYLQGEDYLVDVGFGEFSRIPLRLALGEVQHDGQKAYKVEAYSEEFIMVSREDAGQWVPQYIFKELPRPLGDFKDMCHYNQTSPDSHFTQKRLVSLATETGRITLNDRQLKITRGDEVEVETFEAEEQFESLLATYFYP